MHRVIAEMLPVNLPFWRLEPTATPLYHQMSIKHASLDAIDELIDQTDSDEIARFLVFLPIFLWVPKILRCLISQGIQLPWRMCPMLSFGVSLPTGPTLQPPVRDCLGCFFFFACWCFDVLFVWEAAKDQYNNRFLQQNNKPAVSFHKGFEGLLTWKDQRLLAACETMRSESFCSGLVKEVNVDFARTMLGILRPVRTMLWKSHAVEEVCDG